VSAANLPGRLSGHPLAADLGSLAAAVQEMAAEIVAGPGGVPLIVLGLLGVAILVFDIARALARAAARVVRGREAKRIVATSRATEARALAGSGATLAEIARRTGLARDALAMIVAGDPAAATPPAAAAADGPAGAPRVELPRGTFRRRARLSTAA
jgi:hypothetical protein